MSNIHKFLSGVQLLALVAGLLLVAGGNVAWLQASASVSGQGTIVLHGAAPAASEGLQIQAADASTFGLVPGAPDARWQLLMGMLLMLFAFLLHAFLLLRGEERRVPVRDVSQTVRRERIARTNARKMEVFYVEEVISI